MTYNLYKQVKTNFPINWDKVGGIMNSSKKQLVLAQTLQAPSIKQNMSGKDS